MSEVLAVSPIAAAESRTSWIWSSSRWPAISGVSAGGGKISIWGPTVITVPSP
jgi:hypothetical protein